MKVVLIVKKTPCFVEFMGGVKKLPKSVATAT